MNDVVLESPAIDLGHDMTQAGMTKGRVFALTILLGCFAGLGPLAIDMYLPSFPALAKNFGATIPQVERTLTAYLFGLAIGQLFYGPAADRFGRKPPLYVGLVLFAVASVGCAFAHSVGQLMLLRTLQALGGCAEMVIARAIVRDLFDEREAVGVFSSLMLVMGVAPIVAPLIGAWIVTHLGWHGVFWVLAAAGAVCFVGAFTLLPESLPVERRQRVSVVSTIKLYRRLLTHRIFIVHTLTVSLGCAALFAYVGGSPGLFIETYHVPTEKFGLFFGANAFCLIAMSQVNGRLVRKVDPRKLLWWALAVSVTVSIILLIVILTRFGGLWTICPCLFIFLGTFGFIFPNTTVLAMSPHGANAGNASALLGFFQFMVSAVGGIIVTNLPVSGPVAMTLLIAGCMGVVPIIRVASNIAKAE